MLPADVLRIVLIGDGESPHLLKWARALAADAGVELWAASSRGFAPGFDAAVPAARRLALGTAPSAGGGNVALLRRLPRLARWLRGIDADWLHAHYLTSHGTLAWLAQRGWRLRARIAGSAWGSDILVAPERSAAYRWLTRRVLRACAITTSDSAHMAERMHELGAREVMTFPFGLETLPPEPAQKDEWLFFANRGLEPIYRPERVLAAFAAIAARQPSARLVVANDGSLAAGLPAAARALGLRVGAIDAGAQVQFVGRLDAAAQAAWYARARWYLSLPASDSVAVSVLEAMAYGCIPLLSDLPANRELVRDRANGRLLREDACADAQARTQAECIERPLPPPPSRHPGESPGPAFHAEGPVTPHLPSRHPGESRDPAFHAEGPVTPHPPSHHPGESPGPAFHNEGPVTPHPPSHHPGESPGPAFHDEGAVTPSPPSRHPGESRGPSPDAEAPMMSPAAADLVDSLAALAESAAHIARANRAWVAEHAMFAPAVARFLARLRQFG